MSTKMQRPRHLRGVSFGGWFRGVAAAAMLLGVTASSPSAQADPQVEDLLARAKELAANGNDAEAMASLKKAMTQLEEQSKKECSTCLSASFNKLENKRVGRGLPYFTILVDVHNRSSAAVTKCELQAIMIGQDGRSEVASMVVEGLGPNGKKTVTSETVKKSITHISKLTFKFGKGCPAEVAQAPIVQLVNGEQVKH